MIVATATIAGFKQQIGEKIFGFWGHIHVTSTQINRTTGESVPIDINQSFYPSVDTIGQIEYEEFPVYFSQEMPWRVTKKTNGGVRHIQAFALKSGVIQTKKEIEGIILKGIGNDFDNSFFEKYLIEGERLELGGDKATKGIILSKQTANRLELNLGDKFIFNHFKNGDMSKTAFLVTGIYKTGLEEYDQKFAIVDIREIQRLLSWQPNQVGGFEIFIDDLSDLSTFADFIYFDVIPGDLYCESIRSKYPAIFEWLALQDLNEMVIILLMILVGLINMVTALLILILERTNMIGILKALGQTNWGIRKTFLYQAAYIILMGLFWGNLIGILICFLQSQFGIVQLSEENYYLSEAPIDIDLWTIFMLNIGALIVIMLFLIIPSWLVTRISPVKAIRFK